MKKLLVTVLLFPAALALSAADAPAPPAATNAVILDTASFWRFRTVWETPEILLPSGAVQHACLNAQVAFAFLQANPALNQVPEDHWRIEQVPTARLPAATDAGWMRPGFDDSTWARLRGPMLDGSAEESWKLILMRGLFNVPDPARAGDLTLSLSFRGGAVVYLNGEELARSHLPQGDVDLNTSAEAYPADVYFDKDGYALRRNERGTDEVARVAQRIRRLAPLTIPGSKLKAGVNVLAIGLHRSPTLARVYASHNRGGGTLHQDCFWAKIGLVEVRLTAAPGAAVTPNNGPSTDRGFKVWNQSIIQNVCRPDYPDPFASLSPVRLIGVRNGTFAGQVVVGSDKPIANLKVSVSELKGPGAIPVAAIRVRYGQPDGVPGFGQPAFFDSLEDVPPVEVPVCKANGGSVQPIWITVKVPSEAKPGDYTATLTLTADGINPVSVPLTLRLFDWCLPPIQDYVSRMDLVESPESVAMAYGVPLWSDEHLKLLDQTFALLAELSCKTVFITCVRRTHFGNEHAMVRWIRGDDGELVPDFTIAEKYLDVAARHLGKIPGVVLYCWEPPESQGHASGAGGASRTFDKPILITVVDPATGKLSARNGPSWGSPESPVFWKKLSGGMQAVLAKRGMDKSMLFGLIGDCRPTKLAMDEIGAGVSNAEWAVHSHLFCDQWQGYKIGMGIALWGIGVDPVDPTAGYSFGWSNPMWLSYFPREMKVQSPLVDYRVKLERWMAAKRGYSAFISTGYGPRGLGRIGADFWPVVKDANGRPRGTLAGYYPEGAWGQLSLNNCIPHVLGQGKTGPLATVRSEAFREGLQEVEARIYLERAWLDDEAKGLLGDDLRARIRSTLDDRIRMCLHSEGEGQPWYISSDWAKRSETLFGLAAETAARYGGRAPNPNLKRDEKK